YTATPILTRSLKFMTSKFLEIVEILSQDNTVCIYVISGPFSFSRVAALKYEGLPNNVLFTTIQEIECDIRRYFLIKQDFIKDNMCLIIQKIDEINKKLEFQAKNPAWVSP
ncbi:9113_t:CDS:2, partial [Gigaspora margarita]